MKKLVALLLVSMMATVAFAGLDTDQNSLGIYFDSLGNTNVTTPMTAATKIVWVLLINPTTAIKGFECAYEIVPHADMLPTFGDDLTRLTSVVQGSGFVDLGAMGEFANTGDWRVGYGTARPATAVMPLVRMTFRYYGDADLGMQFFLTGVKSGASVPGGMPAVLNESNIVRTAFLSSGSPLLPVAGTGAVTVVAEEINSFGSVKSLFR
jgi:hypothetical protein